MENGDWRREWMKESCLQFGRMEAIRGSGRCTSGEWQMNCLGDGLLEVMLRVLGQLDLVEFSSRVICSTPLPISGNNSTAWWRTFKIPPSFVFLFTFFISSGLKTKSKESYIPFIRAPHFFPVCFSSLRKSLKVTFGLKQFSHFFNLNLSPQNLLILILNGTL